MPKVSVIVPVYNVSPYIERCARSLFEQTLDELEIIFVDDCSPDDSICKIKNVLTNYPQRQRQTKIIQLSENVGLAGARKKGIEEAHGEYIIHCDADDWVDLSLYHDLYYQAIDTCSDIVTCDMIYEYGNRSECRHFEMTNEIPRNILKKWYRDTLHMSACNKLVKRNIYIENSLLPWTGLNMWEDNGLITRVFYYAHKITSYIGSSAYHYNHLNTNAMTAGYGEKQVNQMIGIASNLAEFFESKPDGAEFEKTVNAFKYLARINLITDSYKRYSRFKKTFPESVLIASELDREAFSRKGKIRFYMVKNGGALLFISLFKLRKLLFK